MTVLLILNVAGGLLLILLALPLLIGSVPPNALYGFRVAATLNNPTLWYAVNTYAARRLILTGACLVLAAILLWFFPGIDVDGYALGCLTAFIVVFGLGLAQSFRYMRALAAEALPKSS
jgi:hypothetical protein